MADGAADMLSRVFSIYAIESKVRSGIKSVNAVISSRRNSSLALYATVAGMSNGSSYLICF